MVFESGQFSSLLGLVGAGVGISLVPAMAVDRRAQVRFVRISDPPAEGILVQGQGVDVGDRLRVRLISTDPVRGYLDFQR